MSRRRILLFGDSLTQQGFDVAQRGWASSVANAYIRRADVINRGFSGYNSRWCLSLAPTVMTELGISEAQEGEPPSVSLVTVLLGSNDLAEGTSQGTSLDEYKRNLASLVEFFTRYTRAASRVVLMTPPPVDAAKWAEYCGSPNRKLAASEAYAQASLEVASASGAIGIDLWTAFTSKEGWERFLSDGLHMAPEGNALIFDELMRSIASKAPDVAPDGAGMPLDAPLWDEIDPDDPEADFNP